jgi:hypothetical protein
VLWGGVEWSVDAVQFGVYMSGVDRGRGAILCASVVLRQNKEVTRCPRMLHGRVCAWSVLRNFD